MQARSEAVLSVRDLSVDFHNRRGRVRVLDGVSFDLMPGETLGIVGESGCGKSMTSLAIMGLLPKPSGRIAGGEIFYRGEGLSRAGEKRMRAIRGKHIGMIFQEPMTSLNPVFTVGSQIMEALRLHERVSDRAARERVLTVLREVGIPAPERRFDEYPHQLSGGMRQRIVIAMALVCRPGIIIADEPTTALDVTVQAQILELLVRLREEAGTALILISHDMGVISQMSDKVLVMYAGRAIESGACLPVIRHPGHPYTRDLIACIPDIETDTGADPAARLPTIEGMVPSLSALGPGCSFLQRCRMAQPACRQWSPARQDVGAAHWALCRRAQEVSP